MMKRLKLLWVGLLILFLSLTNGVGAQQQSFLDWLDDPTHDDSFVVGRTFCISLRDGFYQMCSANTSIRR